MSALLLVMGQSQTSNSRITRGERIEQRKIKSSPDLEDKQLLCELSVTPGWNNPYLDNALVTSSHHVLPISRDKHGLQKKHHEWRGTKTHIRV